MSAKSDSAVLVVDDFEGVRDVASATLETEGYEVHTARTGEEALEILERHTGEILAVVLDLGLPGIGGEQTYREIRRLAPGLPVVLMSGDAAGGDVTREAERRGPHTFLLKPFSPLELMQTLSELLAG